MLYQNFEDFCMLSPEFVKILPKIPNDESKSFQIVYRVFFLSFRNILSETGVLSALKIWISSKRMQKMIFGRSEYFYGIFRKVMVGTNLYLAFWIDNLAEQGGLLIYLWIGLLNFHRMPLIVGFWSSSSPPSPYSLLFARDSIQKPMFFLNEQWTWIYIIKWIT